MAASAAVTLAAVVGGLAPLVAAPAAEAPPLFEQVGTLERFPADARAALGTTFVPLPGPGQENPGLKTTSGTLIALPPARLLVQVFRNPSGGTTALAFRDLDTLRLVKTLTLPAVLRRATVDSSGAGGDWAHAVDDAGGRLWLAENNGANVYEVDLRTFATKKRPIPNQFLLGGMTYDPFEEDLLVLLGGPPTLGVANFNTVLYRLDVSVAPPASLPPQELARQYRLRSCTGPLSTTDSAAADTSNWDILVTRDLLYVPCQRAGHTVVVVRMPRPEANLPTHPEEVVAGPVWGASVLADPDGGRLFVTTFLGREVWVFDAATMSFVGVVATGPDRTTNRTGFGLDADTGRVFFQSSTFGLGVVEGRFFPVPQARTFPRKAEGQERIWADAATGRVFVLEGSGETKAPAWRIYRTAPAPVPPAPPDPDRNTTDVAEREGVTESRYNASGSGYGSRALWARGLAAVPPAPSVGVNNPVADAIKAINAKCSFTDRDLFAGRVARAEYDTGSTAAAAAAVVVDGSTEQDLNEPSRCGAPTQADDPDDDGDPARWAQPPAECASNEGMDKAPDPSTGSSQGKVPALGTSTVACPLPGGTLEASAETRLTGGAVEVAHAETKTTIERTAAGVVSVVESTARGISVAGVLHIGEVRSKATSTSNGRPGRRPMSTHEIAIADVRLAGTALCTAVCTDPVELERTLNLAAGGRAVFRTGHGATSGRDEDLVGGSPRGAQTAVQKSVARQASDRALMGDFTVEVPAFEVTVFNDNTVCGRCRQLYQFAGVASAATYNVVVRPTGFGFGDPGADTATDDAFAAADGGDTVFGDLYGEPALVGGYALGPTAAVSGSRDDGDGGVVGAVRALARGLRLFLTSPRTAALLLSAWALLGSPAVLSRRRRLLEGVRSA